MISRVEHIPKLVLIDQAPLLVGLPDTLDPITSWVRAASREKTTACNVSSRPPACLGLGGEGGGGGFRD